MGTEIIPKTEEAVPAEIPSTLEQQIIRQIEYYFGNYNLCRDKFLREQLKLDDGWVPLEILIKFNRLKRLSEDFAVITGALKKSPKQLLEVNEDCTKIRRRMAEPLPEDYSKRQEELEKRTLYVKGFKRENTLDELLDFFKEHNVENILMRKNMQQKERSFKGSVFATFDTEEAAKKFFETKGISYNGVDLLKEWKKDYTKRKDEEFKLIKESREKKLAKRSANDKDKPDTVADIEVIPGCLLKLTGLKGETLREHIKEVFDPLGTLVYVDYSKGNPSAVIRFETGIASSVLEKLPEEEGARKAEINSFKVDVTLVEGEEETDYWKNIAVSRAQSRLKFVRGGNRNQYKGGNKGRFRKWGKRRGNEDNSDETSEPLSKKVKTEVKTEDSEGKDKESAKMDSTPEGGKVTEEATS